MIYAIGVVGVTALGNVPLNEALDKFNLSSASVETIADERSKFEGSWNRFHAVRTIASIISLVLVIIACLNNQSVESKQID